MADKQGLKAKRLSARFVMSMSHDSDVAPAVGVEVPVDEALRRVAGGGLSDNDLMVSSPARPEGILPAHLQGPWLLDYEDLQFFDLMDESSYTEV